MPGWGGGAGGALRGEYLGRSREPPHGTGAAAGRGRRSSRAACGKGGLARRGAAGPGLPGGGGRWRLPLRGRRRRSGVTSGHPLCSGGRALPNAARRPAPPPRARGGGCDRARAPARTAPLAARGGQPSPSEQCFA